MSQSRENPAHWAILWVEREERKLVWKLVTSRSVLGWGWALSCSGMCKKQTPKKQKTGCWGFLQIRPACLCISLSPHYQFVFICMFCDIIKSNKTCCSTAKRAWWISRTAGFVSCQESQKLNLLFGFLTSAWLIMASANSSLEAVVPDPHHQRWVAGGWYFHLRLQRGTNPWQLCPSGTISVALLVVWYNGLPPFVLEIVLISPTAGVGAANIRLRQDWQISHDTAGPWQTRVPQNHRLNVDVTETTQFMQI